MENNGNGCGGACDMDLKGLEEKEKAKKDKNPLPQCFFYSFPNNLYISQQSKILYLGTEICKTT